MEAEHLAKVDKMGRFVIPIGLRKVLNINEGDFLELGRENNQLIVTKQFDKCEFCNSKNNLQDYCGKKICSSCLSNIKNNI